MKKRVQFQYGSLKKKCKIFQRENEEFSIISGVMKSLSEPYWVQFAPTALQDLRDIWRGLAEYGTLTVADAKIAMLQNKLMLLSQFPESGRRREEFPIGMRSFPAVEFIIFYRVFDDYIQIVRVLNGRRDIESIFKEPEN
jgi:toxin ParE1/3/4